MAHYLLSVSNSYEQNFSSREFRGIFESKKVCIRQNKKNKLHQRVLTECFEKHFEKNTCFLLASQKRNFLALSHLFWIGLWVSKQNSWKKQFKDSP